MYISGSSPLHYFRCVGVLFGGGVPDDRSVFKCWSGLGHLPGLRLRKMRVLLAFFVIASTWWFQDSLLFMLR